MNYYIKRGGKVQKPISHEQLMSLAKQKKLKKSDLIGNSKAGSFQELATVWDLVKSSKPVPEEPIILPSSASAIPKEDWMTMGTPTKEETSLNSAEVVLAELVDQTTYPKYIAISSTIVGLLAILSLGLPFFSVLFSIAGIAFGIVAILKIKKYRPLGYVGAGLSCLAFMCLLYNSANNPAIEKRRNEDLLAKLAKGKKLNQERAEARWAIYESNKPRTKAAKEAAKAEKEIEAECLTTAQSTAKMQVRSGSKSLSVVEKSVIYHGEELDIFKDKEWRIGLRPYTNN
jgi:hypothetical protein